MKVILNTAVIFFLILFPLAAGAAEIEPYTCRNGLFPDEQKDISLAKFAGKKDARLYFFDDDKGCPADEKRCRTKAYLVPDDEVIVDRIAGSWACVWYHGKKHETVGWVKTVELVISKDDKTRPLNDWVGNWAYYKDAGKMKIKRNGDALSVTAFAIWQGGTDESGEPIAHTGDFEGDFKPVKNRAVLKDGDAPENCRMDVTLIGRYLVVSDNSNCGGLNVRFNGVYTKSGR